MATLRLSVLWSMPNCGILIFFKRYFSSFGEIPFPSLPISKIAWRGSFSAYTLSPIDQYRPGVREVEAGHQVEERGFPASRWTEKADKFPLPDFQVHAVERQCVVSACGELTARSAYLDCRRARLAFGHSLHQPGGGAHRSTSMASWPPSARASLSKSRA